MIHQEVATTRPQQCLEREVVQLPVRYDHQGFDAIEQTGVLDGADQMPVQAR